MQMPAPGRRPLFARFSIEMPSEQCVRPQPWRPAASGPARVRGSLSHFLGVAFDLSTALGIFTDLVRFCAARWGDKGLRDVHYQLKNSRQIRNAGAHGACILNDVASPLPSKRSLAVLVNAMNALGISKRLRSKWLRSRRMVQICSLLYLFSQIVPNGEVRSDRKATLMELFAEADACGLPPENPSIAALLFLKRLTSSLGLLD